MATVTDRIPIRSTGCNITKFLLPPQEAGEGMLDETLRVGVETHIRWFCSAHEYNTTTEYELQT